MKRTLINIFFEVPVYMTAGLGLVSGVHIIMSYYETLPTFLLVLGLAFGLLIWKIEINSIKKISFGGNMKYIKTYIYIHTFIIYILSIIGVLELIYFFLGYPDLTFGDLISWKLVFILLPYLAAWDTTAELLISDVKKNMEVG